MKSLHSMLRTTSPPTGALKVLLKKFRGDLVLVVCDETNINLGYISRNRRKPLLGVGGSFKLDVSIRKIFTDRGHVRLSSGRWIWVDGSIFIPVIDFWKVTRKAENALRAKSPVGNIVVFVFGRRAVREYFVKKGLNFMEAFSALKDY